MNRLFISHASEDKQFVKQLIECLNHKKIMYWFDVQEIHPGDSIPQKINEGLRLSTHGVLILSSNYLREDKFWTWEELGALLNIESISNKRLLIPVRLGLDHSQLTRLAPLIAHRLSIDFIGNPQRAAEEIASLLAKGAKPVRLHSGELIPEEGLPTRHNVPMGRPFGSGFIGRGALVSSLLDQLKTGRERDFSDFGVLVLTGIPGSGKSTVACELAYRIGRQFSGGVFWFDARTAATLDASAKTLGELLHPITSSSVSDKGDEKLYDIIRYYFESQPCLVIFDALDSELAALDLMQLMPKTGVSRVVITTRTERLDLPIRLNSLQVTVLDLSSAREVLMQFRPVPQNGCHNQDVDHICQELGFLPLALQLAARYLGRYSLSLSDYLDRFRKRGPGWKGLASTIQALPSVIEVLKQCVEDVSGRGEVGELAKKILRCCAAIDLVQGKLHRWDHRSFQGTLPLGIASSVGVVRDDEEAVEKFEDAVGILEQVGLIRLIPNSDKDLWAHSLTLQFAREYLDAEDAQYLSFRFKIEWSDTQYLMGLVGCVDYFPQMYQPIRFALPLMKRLSPDAALDALRTLYLMADFSSQAIAEEIIDEALDFAKTLSDDPNRSIMILELRIAKAYSAYKAKRLNDAEKLYDLLLEDSKRKKIGAHVDQLTDCLYFFGCLLLELGGNQRRTRALKLWDSAIEMLIEELSMMESKDAPLTILFHLKIRLCRLFQARSEKFPEVPIDYLKAKTAKSLMTELEPLLGADPMSLHRQFLYARSPLNIMMTVRCKKKWEGNGK